MGRAEFNNKEKCKEYHKKIHKKNCITFEEYQISKHEICNIKSLFLRVLIVNYDVLQESYFFIKIQTLTTSTFRFTAK